MFLVEYGGHRRFATSFTVGPLSEALGRRGEMLHAAVLYLVGTLLTWTSARYASARPRG